MKIQYDNIGNAALLIACTEPKGLQEAVTDRTVLTGDLFHYGLFH